jgi:hypothetical protein
MGINTKNGTTGIITPVVPFWFGCSLFLVCSGAIRIIKDATGNWLAILERSD